jgi:hypothetical protein
MRCGQSGISYFPAQIGSREDSPGLTRFCRPCIAQLSCATSSLGRRTAAPRALCATPNASSGTGQGAPLIHFKFNLGVYFHGTRNTASNGATAPPIQNSGRRICGRLRPLHNLAAVAAGRRSVQWYLHSNGAGVGARRDYLLCFDGARFKCSLSTRPARGLSGSGAAS